MPTAAAAPIAAAAISGLSTMIGTGLALTPDGQPELADTNKDALTSYAQKLADEEQKIGEQNDFLLRSGGRPITFSNQSKRLPQKFLLS